MLRNFDRDFIALEMARGVYAQARRELELAQAERVEEVTA
jgi:hypothetical protein